MIYKYKQTYIEELFLRSRLNYQASPLSISRAPDPEEIIWNNLTYGFWTKTGRTLLTWGATLFLLGICFSINISLSIWAKNTRDEEDNISLATFITLLISLFIVIMNAMLGRIVPIFTRLEKHHTITEYQISLAFKLALAMFINSTIIPLAINGKDEYFTTGTVYAIYSIYIYIYILYTIYRRIN